MIDPYDVMLYAIGAVALFAMLFAYWTGHAVGRGQHSPPPAHPAIAA